MKLCRLCVKIEKRLGEAGLGDVQSLALANPDRVAEAAGVSAARARNWIQLASDR